MSGSLTVKKLNQSITLPDGSTFNGSANLTTNQLSGDVFIPEFTSTIRVLGVPTRVTTKLDQAQPVQGTVALDSAGVHIRSTSSAILRIKRLRLGLLSVPTTCRTAEPIVLDAELRRAADVPDRVQRDDHDPAADRLRPARPDARDAAERARQRLPPGARAAFLREPSLR